MSKTLMNRKGVKVTYSKRYADSPMGRFGGGWQWKVGVQASKGFRTIIVHLLVASMRIERRKTL